MAYPKLREDKNLFVFDGKKIDDPYQWIRDKKNKELKAWVKEENAYTEDFFKKHKDVYKKYYDFNKNKEAHPSYSSVSKSDNGYILTKTLEGIYEVIEVDKSFNKIRDFKDMLSKVKNTTFFSAMMCPKDNNYIAFLGQLDGADRPSVHVFDLKKKKLLKKFDGVFDYSFIKDSYTLLFGDAKADVKNKITRTYLKSYDIREDKEKLLFAYPGNAITTDGHSIKGDDEVVASVKVDYSNNLLYFIKNGKASAYLDKPAVLEYVGHNSKGNIIVNFSKKNHGEVIAIKNNKEEVLFSNPKVFIKSVSLLGSKIYVFGTKDVSTVVYEIDKDIKEIKLPRECSVEILNESDPSKDKLVCSIESFTMAPEVFFIKNGKCEPLNKDIKDDETIEVKKVFYPSKDDGKKIPAFLVYKKGLKKNGKLPTLMYGYGGYNLSMPPTYHNPFIGIDIVDWVNKGGLYVNCCLRGGNEYGEKWHLEGYKLKKKNCYYDFIGIAEGIIKDGYTSSKHIAINGGSNGGLLVTALLTMRPDLWGCVVGSVPHTDMISFVNDDRGPMYITEYGDPHEDKQFDYFMTYSPFHNIRKVKYPPTYIQTGECDNNVPPYHGKKFAARLQQYNKSDNPILLRVLAKGSHDRGKGRVYLKTVSEMQTFVEIALGLKEEK